MKAQDIEKWFKGILGARTMAGVEDMTYKEVQAMNSLPPFPEHEA